jgi:3-(3-hydroxy-phenyl)propionate hydroxylase
VVDDEIMRIFQYIELINEILPLTRVLKGEQFLSSKRQILATATIASDKNGYAATNTFYQPQLEAVLRKGVERFPGVRIYSGYEVRGLSQDRTGVTLTMQHPAQGVKQLRARYVLGCDGAHSITRMEAGIQLLDLHMHKAWLVIDALLKDDEPDLEAEFVQQYCDTLRPETYVPSVGQHRRWEFMLTGGESKEEMTRVDKVGNLLSSWVDPSKLEIVRAAVYTFHALMAQEWSRDRLFLLGDAAHQMPPFIGQGMCTGMRDAHNLCWKVALVLRGHAQPTILASYEQERMPQAYAVISASVDFGKIIQARQPVAAIRNSILPLLARLPGAFAQSLPPLRSGLFMHSPSGSKPPQLKKRILLGTLVSRHERKLAQGILFPQPQVYAASGARVPLDEILGQGFAIIGLNVNPYACLDASAIAVWERLSTRFVQVNACNSSAKQTPEVKAQPVICVKDSEDILTRWFAHRPGTVAVVRPDRYVFGMFTPSTLHIATERLNLLLQPSKTSMQR